MSQIHSIQKLHFSMGGYFNDFNYELNYTNGVVTFDRIIPPASQSDEKIRKPINLQKMNILIGELNTLQLLDWNKTYDSGATDGMQWELMLTYNGNLRKKVYGSNAYPDNFNDLLNSLRTFISNKGFFGRDDYSIQNSTF